MRDDGHSDFISFNLGNGETDAFNRKRTLENHVARQFWRDLDAQPVVIGIRNSVESEKFSRAVHMSLNKMAAETSVNPHGQFEIYQRPFLDPRKRGAVPGFFGQIGSEGFVGDLYRGQANTADCNAVALAQFFREMRGRDG